MAENVKRIANTVSVNDVIDQAKFTKFHLSIVLWCLFIVLFDGYDCKRPLNTPYEFIL